MNKIIHSGSWDFDAPAVQLIDIHSRGVDSSWMQKRAAALGPEISQIRAEPGRTALHLIAMGTTESFGPNRNADGFRRNELMRKHATFVTNGNVFKNHANKDPKRASGTIKYSAFNPTMDRVELVIAVDNNKWATELEKLASGEDLPFSMACKVAFDECNICKNQAPSRKQYCQCMKKMAGQILADGRQVYVDNPNPNFFDLSGVFRPADRIAYHLQKVASAGVVTGADLAELEGLTADWRPITKYSSIRWKKLAALRKLSDIEKEIEATAPGHGIRSLSKAFAGNGRPADSDVEQLSGVGRDRLNKLMGALGQAQISLPLRDFIKIVLGDEANGVNESSAEQHLPGIFTRMLDEGGDEASEDGTYDPEGSSSMLSAGIKQIIDKMIPGMSLGEGPVGHRMQITIIRKIPDPKMLTGGGAIHTIKSAEVDAGAELVAREYAKYKLALLAGVMEKESSEVSIRLGVLQNYLCL